MLLPSRHVCFAGPNKEFVSGGPGDPSWPGEPSKLWYSLLSPAGRSLSGLPHGSKCYLWKGAAGSFSPSVISKGGRQTESDGEQRRERPGLVGSQPPGLAAGASRVSLTVLPPSSDFGGGKENRSGGGRLEGGGGGRGGGWRRVLGGRKKRIRKVCWRVAVRERPSPRFEVFTWRRRRQQASLKGRLVGRGDKQEGEINEKGRRRQSKKRKSPRTRGRHVKS